MVTKNNSDNGESTNNFVSPEDNLRVNVGNILFVLVDDVKRAEVNLKKTNAVSFDLTVNDKEIKVYADDKFGKMFIERFPLNFEDLGAENQSETFKLKGGQKVTFNFNPVLDKDNQVIKIVCKLVYAANEKAGIFNAKGLTASGAAQSPKSNVLLWGLAGAFALLLLMFGVGLFVLGDFGKTKPDVSKNQLTTTQKDNNKPVEAAERQTSIEPAKPTTANAATNANNQTATDNFTANNASNSNITAAPENDYASNAKKSVRRRTNFETAKLNTATNKANNAKSTIIASANTTKDKSSKLANNNKFIAQTKTSNVIKNNVTAKRVSKDWVKKDVSLVMSIDNPTAADNSTTTSNDKDTIVNKKVIAANATPNNEVLNTEGKSLLEIKQIYLDWQGDLELGTKINGQVIEEVQKSGLLNVSDKMVADAALKIFVSRDTDATTKETADKPRIKASMWLVNKAGVIVTPNTKGTSDWKYVGELEKLPIQIVKDVKMLTGTDK